MTPAPNIDGLEPVAWKVRAPGWGVNVWHYMGSLPHWASESAPLYSADALAALRAENERLAAQVQGLREGWDADSAHMRAERDAALALLRRVIYCNDLTGWGYDDASALYDDIDAALAAKEQP